MSVPERAPRDSRQTARPRRMAMTNQSGGSCKTTSATALGAIIAKRGKRVLKVDCDSQFNASTILGGERIPQTAPTIYSVLKGQAKLQDAIVPAAYRNPDGTFEVIPNLDLVVGSRAMGDADSDLTLDPVGAFWLQNALAEIEDRYDLIIVDCPASLGRLMVSILVAVDEIVGCVKPGYKELEAIIELEVSMGTVREKFGKFGAAPQLTYVLVGDAPTARSQGVIYDEAKEEARSLYGDKVLPIVRRDVRVPEAYKDRQALPIYDPAGPAAKDYELCADAMGFAA